MSVPSMTIDPDVGASSPASRPSSVDFPLPDGPTMATNCPEEIVKSSGWRIVSGWPPLSTVFDTPRSSIIDLSYRSLIARSVRLQADLLQAILFEQRLE